MTIIPPSEGVFDEPTTCLTVNQSWVSILLGLLEPGEKEWFWDSDVEDGQDGIREIASALVLGNCPVPVTAQPYILLNELANANTPAGGFTAGAWQLRPALLTEEVDSDNLCSVASGLTFTLQIGTYDIHAIAPAFMVGRHRIRLWNETLSGVQNNVRGEPMYGSSAYSEAGSHQNHTVSHLIGRFTLTGISTMRIEHRCETTKATNGYGLQTNFTGKETYMQIQLWKVD